MYRTLVILWHTFLEAVFQPIYSLMLVLGAAILITYAFLPFFTFSEDTVMYISVGLDIILILVLITTLFATSKSIYEEIEDRTMLTLMSKPVAKWQVMVGKYLGIVLAALLAVCLLGFVIGLCVWLRIPGDYIIRTMSIDDREMRNLWETRMMHLAGLIPSLLLLWLQVAMLAAVGVALSTRLPLVVNLPVVILLYFAGNLTRFMFPLEGAAAGLKGLAHLVATVLPYLENLDLRSLTVNSPIKLSGTQFALDSRAVLPATIWHYIAVAGLYAGTYIVFALCTGMWLFQNRELGGGEG